MFYFYNVYLHYNWEDGLYIEKGFRAKSVHWTWEPNLLTVVSPGMFSAKITSQCRPTNIRQDFLLVSHRKMLCFILAIQVVGQNVKPNKLCSMRVDSPLLTICVENLLILHFMNSWGIQLSSSENWLRTEWGCWVVGRVVTGNGTSLHRVKQSGSSWNSILKHLYSLEFYLMLKILFLMLGIKAMHKWWFKVTA